MRNRWAAVVIGCFLVIGMYQAKPEGYYGVTDFDYSPQVISSQRLAVSTANEYQPIWVQKQPDQPAPDNHLLVIEGQVRELSSRMNSDRYKWNLEANGSARLRIATFYYPGWKVYIDNQPREVQITNPYGMMDILLDSGVHKIVATFEETTLRSAAIWISIAILGILIAILLIPRKRKH
jgi:hypothetical protein